MRIIVFVVFYLGFHNVFAHASSENPTLPTAAFNCEELSSYFHNLKESPRSKKEKFSCILNLLKDVLSEELDITQCQAETKDITPLEGNSPEVIEDTENNGKTILEVDVSCEKNWAGKELVAEIEEETEDRIDSTKILEITTMIPIFKPRPVMRNDINPARPRSIPVQAARANPNPRTNPQKFAIPCQRAADILDMSSPPKETGKKDQTVQSVQPIFTPNTPASSSTFANQTPTAVFVHSTDSDETMSILFKPKSISLIQLYGDLLKKITVTVLVPYHMSKIGQQVINDGGGI